MRLGSLLLLQQDSLRPRASHDDTPHAGRNHARRLQVISQLASTATVVALWPHVEQPFHLTVWWLAMTLVLALLQGAYRPLCTHTARSEDAALHHYFSSASVIASGAAWGSLALAGPYHASPQSQAIVFMVLGGVTLTGAGTLQHSRSTTVAFIAACLLPLFILSVASPPPAMREAGLWLVAVALFAFGLHVLQQGHDASSDSQPKTDDLPPEPRQTLLDNASAALVLSRGHRVDLCNRRFAEIMHCSEHEIAGLRLARVFENRVDWRRHARAAANAIRRGDTYHGSIRLQRRDGSVFSAEVTGQAVDGTETPPRIVWVAFDITDKIDATSREELHGAQLRALVCKSADWYWQTDSQHRLMHVSRHADIPHDDTLEHSLGRKWWQFHRSGREPSGQAALREAFENGKGFRNLTVELSNGQHGPRWLLLSGMPRLNEHGAFLGHHGTANDITEQVRGSERVRHLAYHDALTGLPNRRLLTDRLNQAIARAQRYHERVGVILVDLDDFRRINDLGGHPAGDRALLETADLLRNCVRSSDSVARLGSDEFVVLLTELEHSTSAEQVAAKIMTALLASHATHKPISASIGVAVFPEDAGSADGLIEVADARMYRAKRRGGQHIESRERATTIPGPSQQPAFSGADAAPR